MATDSMRQLMTAVDHAVTPLYCIYPLFLKKTVLLLTDIAEAVVEALEAMGSAEIHRDGSILVHA